ncbi:MAG: hypothetical protein LBC40_05230, partial [Dysgonamonadaceae bacterium]|nr:hypothetical protein [Dysgonamonadaceae bacterium]
MKTSKMYMSGLLLSLALGFGSCDKDLPGGKGTGALIAVKVNLLGVAAGGSEEIARSDKQMPETVTASLGDGITLEMSIEREAQPLRAATTQALEAPKKYRLMAIRSSDSKLISLADCEVGDLNNPTLHVPEGTECRFICISYNSETLPAAPDDDDMATYTLAVDNSNDLLYWQDSELNRVITDIDNELNIILEHQQTKIKVLVDSSPMGQNITNISATGITLSVATGGSFNYLSSDVTGTVEAKKLTWSTTANNQVRESATVPFFPNATSTPLTISFPIHSVTIGGVNMPSIQKSLSFSALTLAKGTSYTLRVMIKRFTQSNKFAGSNIYW